MAARAVRARSANRRCLVIHSKSESCDRFDGKAGKKLRCGGVAETAVLPTGESRMLVRPRPVPVRLLEVAPWVLGLTVAKASRRL
jgi:hypothetical protein